MNKMDHERALLAMIRARRGEGFTILAFASYSYLEVLLNWLLAMERLGIRSYIIVSLDEKLYAYLSERAIPTVLSPLKGGLNQLWVKRIKVFQLLIDHEITFIHSDIDAIWLKNPIPKYFSHPEYDLIISQGTIWPPDVVRNRGFVLCCGLFYLRSNEAARYLLDEMESDVHHSGDDQITLNRIIESYSVQWEISRKHTYQLKHRGMPFVCSREPITGISTSKSLKICVLPHHHFQRLHMPDKEAYVKHLLSPKMGGSKLELFRRSGCMFLRPDWQAVDFDVNSLKNLAIETRR